MLKRLLGHLEQNPVRYSTFVHVDKSLRVGLEPSEGLNNRAVIDNGSDSGREG